MTKQEFDNLKIGDGVYCFNSRERDTLFSTVVLDIDRLFGKVKILLKSKPLSYKYLKKKSDFSKVTFICGIYKKYDC